MASPVKSRTFRAPGRVNLIGEHTDYNGGFVLPMAIDRAVTIVAESRADRIVRFTSEAMQASVDIGLDASDAAIWQLAPWARYVGGVLRVLACDGPLVGADLRASSTIPLGAGLSSSAALEVATGLALASLAGRSIGALELARVGQEAENRFAGVASGILDQCASVFGRADHALLIDCRSLAIEAIPVALRNAAFVVCDSGVRHGHAGGEYNARRHECETAVDALRGAGLFIESLRDVTAEQFEAAQEHVLEPARSRARHVINENGRTLAAAQALRDGDARRFGGLMTESHASLRDDYAVSSPELDTLVEAALTVPGTYGTRMTGGGFGGCTISLVATPSLAPFRRAVTEAYYTRTGRTPSIEVVTPADGARELSDATQS